MPAAGKTLVTKFRTTWLFFFPFLSNGQIETGGYEKLLPAGTLLLAGCGGSRGPSCPGPEVLWNHLQADSLRASLVSGPSQALEGGEGGSALVRVSLPKAPGRRPSLFDFWQRQPLESLRLLLQPGIQEKALVTTCLIAPDFCPRPNVGQRDGPGEETHVGVTAHADSLSCSSVAPLGPGSGLNGPPQPWPIILLTLGSRSSTERPGA